MRRTAVIPCAARLTATVSRRGVDILLPSTNGVRMMLSCQRPSRTIRQDAAGIVNLPHDDPVTFDR
jgi:hypothetical protein